MQGDTGRYSQILERYIKIPQKNVHARTTGIAQPRATLIPMSKLILAPFGALPMSILVPVLRGPGRVFMVAARTDSQDVSVTFTLLLFF